MKPATVALTACVLCFVTAMGAAAQNANQTPKADPAAPQQDDTISIEQLLKDGWQVAGFTSTCDNRSALTLFRHPTEPALVQCLSGYDVTRTPRTYSNCYHLH